MADLHSALFSLLLCAGLAVAVAAWVFGPLWLTALRRARVRRQPFPAAWREILRRRMPAFAQLPADLQLQLKKHVQVLLAEKPVIGCAGLVVDDEVRVLVMAQAALLLLGRPAQYFPKLRQVLVYPAGFVVRRTATDPVGLAREERLVLLGESWQQGQVLLSWADVLQGAAVPGDGHNLVLHEFAHQLDQESGRANGAPWLGGRARAARWATVMAAEFAALQRRVARAEPGLIDPYGATDPAEFFAVLSELFFECPQALAAEHPALFEQLAGYYRVNPLSW